MQLDNLRAFTSRSDSLLAQAKRYAKEAEALPQGDPKRTWLEEEAARLIGEARELISAAKKQVKSYE